MVLVARCLGPTMPINWNELADQYKSAARGLSRSARRTGSRRAWELGAGRRQRLGILELATVHREVSEGVLRPGLPQCRRQLTRAADFFLSASRLLKWSTAASKRRT